LFLGDGFFSEVAYGAGMTHFTERHADKIAFDLSCFDRVLISGSLVDVGHAQAMPPG
jgi:hypothetical protein